MFFGIFDLFGIREAKVGPIAYWDFIKMLASEFDYKEYLYLERTIGENSVDIHT